MKWTEVAGNDMPELSKGKRMIYVEDGTVGHAVELPEEKRAGEAGRALADYELGYDAGEPQEIRVRFERWIDGKLTALGDYVFEAK